MADREPVQVADTVDAELDRMAIAHLDFQPTCTIKKVWVVASDVLREEPPCGVPAVWAAECRTCSNVARLCDEHKESSLLRKRSRCMRCGVVGDPFLLFAYARIGGA